MSLEKRTSGAKAVKRAGYPSLDSLFPNLLGSVKASGGHLKNLIWTNLADLSPGLRPISANLSRVFFFDPHKIVILGGCDFFDLFVFSAYSTSCTQAPHKTVILSGAPHRSSRDTALG